MKVLLCVILIAVAFCHDSYVVSLADSSEPTGENLYDFIRGFYDGLGVKEDLEKIRECLKQFENEFEKFVIHVQEAMEHLKKMTFGELKIGLELLFSAVTEFFTKILSCFGEESFIRKLIRIISGANIVKLIAAILLHPVLFTEYVLGCIIMFAQKDYYRAGKAVGAIFHILFM